DGRVSLLATRTHHSGNRIICPRSEPAHTSGGELRRPPSLRLPCPGRRSCLPGPDLVSSLRHRRIRVRPGCFPPSVRPAGLPVLDGAPADALAVGRPPAGRKEKPHGRTSAVPGPGPGGDAAGVRRLLLSPLLLPPLLLPPLLLPALPLSV